MKKLILLVGAIGSGKSTLASKLAERGALVVDPDAITLMVHGGHYLKYDENLKGLYRNIELATIRAGIEAGRPVVIDKTLLDPEQRARFINYVKFDGVEIVAVEFPVEHPHVHARRRFYSNNRGHSLEKWRKVCEEHVSKYAPPHRDEGIDYIVSSSFASPELLIPEEDNAETTLAVPPVHAPVSSRGTCLGPSGCS